MEPRYEPTWSHETNDEVFIGQAGALDIYYERNKDYDEAWIIAVGPDERKIYDDRQHNFDVYEVRDGNRLVLQTHELQDIHIELHEMCEIYALAVARGYIKEPEEI
jgi:hypothetical protein